jgi:hypothetical protein
MSNMKTLTQEYLKELFYYEDGTLYWKKSGSGRVHKNAGCMHRNGYIVITIDGKQYPAHRLIYLYHHGYMPEPEIDHKNRKRSDNKIDNLREASVSCNQRNRGNPSNNKSGIKGVWYDNREKKWRAGIRNNNIQSNLGCFSYKYEAVLMRLAAEQCLNWAGCDSSSPAYQYALKHKLIKKKGKCHVTNI